MTAEQAVKRYIGDYVPQCEQEAADREQMLAFWRNNPDAFLRENTAAHFTASGWIVDHARTKALMVFHNIYRSWAWTGGHADGDAELLAVAVREAREETGVEAFPVSAMGGAPISIESICVAPHVRRGVYVSAHIHMNVTFLLEADPDAPLRVRESENSAVKWIPFGEVETSCSEPEMTGIYRKLMERAAL